MHGHVTSGFTTLSIDGGVALNGWALFTLDITTGGLCTLYEFEPSPRPFDCCRACIVLHKLEDVWVCTCRHRDTLDLNLGLSEASRCVRLLYGRCWLLFLPW